MHSGHISIGGGESLELAVGPAVPLAATAPERQSANINWCLFVIYYFSFSDFVLKFVPLQIAIALRYLPEILIYVLAAILLARRVVLSHFLFSGRL